MKGKPNYGPSELRSLDYHLQDTLLQFEMANLALWSSQLDTEYVEMADFLRDERDRVVVFLNHLQERVDALPKARRATEKRLRRIAKARKKARRVAKAET